MFRFAMLLFLLFSMDVFSKCKISEVSIRKVDKKSGVVSYECTYKGSLRTYPEKMKQPKIFDTKSCLPHKTKNIDKHLYKTDLFDQIESRLLEFSDDDKFLVYQSQKATVGKYLLWLYNPCVEKIIKIDPIKLISTKYNKLSSCFGFRAPSMIKTKLGLIHCPKKVDYYEYSGFVNNKELWFNFYDFYFSYNLETREISNEVTVEKLNNLIPKSKYKVIFIDQLKVEGSNYVIVGKTDNELVKHVFYKTRGEKLRHLKIWGGLKGNDDYSIFIDKSFLKYSSLITLYDGTSLGLGEFIVTHDHNGKLLSKKYLGFSEGLNGIIKSQYSRDGKFSIHPVVNKDSKKIIGFNLLTYQNNRIYLYDKIRGMSGLENSKISIKFSNNSHNVFIITEGRGENGLRKRILWQYVIYKKFLFDHPLKVSKVNNSKKYFSEIISSKGTHIAYQIKNGAISISSIGSLE